MHLAAAITVLALTAGAAVGVTGLPGPGRRDRLMVGALALGTRLAFGALVWVALAARGRAVVFPDEEVFLGEARGVAGGGPLLTHGYSNLLGSLFKLTGPSAWLPRLLNVVAGALLAVIVLELVRLLAGRRAGWWAAVAVSLWPSLILWSVVALKDAMTLLAVFGILLGATSSWRGRGRVVPAAGALAAMATLEGLRPYAFVIASIALAAGLMTRLAVGARRTVVPLGALVMAVGLLGLLGGEGFLGIGFVRSNADTEVVAKARVEGNAGVTGFGGAPPRTTGDVVRGIPRGLFYSVLGPLPWDAGAVEARGLLLVELPLWYAALAASVVALLRLGWRRLTLRWLVLLVFAAGVVAILSTYEGNAGTALRQRAMVIPVVLGLAATLLRVRASRAEELAVPSSR